MLTPAQRIEQDAWCRAEHVRLASPDPTPTEAAARAIAELLMGLLCSADSRERRRIAPLLAAVCTEAAQCDRGRAA